MTDDRFYMIGVIHRDHKAKDRLKQIVKSINPELITLEFTNYGLTFRKKNYSSVKKKLIRIEATLSNLAQREKIRNLLNFFELPYEYVVANSYAKEKGVPLYLVDMDFFSFFRLRYAKDLLKKENIRGILANSDLLEIQRERKMAEMFFNKGIKAFHYTEDMRVRDEYVFRLIKRIIAENPGKKLVHICGWQHLSDPFGFFSELRPQKIYIYDKAFRI
ncbi:MAG: hypothetical protein N2513_09695 [Deltaproteobacteria bacterium]|nr:hypothetical protein [Deltaproteobacteria bacterium]